MTTKYFAILTHQGAARLANATALGTKLNITQMAVGDGNGTLPTPDPAQTKLINERRRELLNSLAVDANDTGQIIAEQIIPENEGGFFIREIGLYDDEGILIAVANCPETYKPLLAEGSGRTQTIRMILVVSSTSAITLKIDPSVVLATRKYVDDAVIEVKSYADKLMKDHEAKANPHKQYPLIANALKEMADAGLVAEVLKNLGLRASGQYTDNLLFTGPDGLKIQVFRRTLANLTTVGVVNSVPVTFPVPFPVNCWGVFSTKLTWVQITNSCEWVSNTGFTAQVMMNIAVNTNTSDAMFLAIGY
ncbi:phage tail protein [Escherichia coli]|uniref:phage tail protein n=1 Tax=Escherichia coli TaxID=562 RepID=UPI000B7CE2BD|nr:phage tail protein [Escherichia coli]